MFVNALPNVASSIRKYDRIVHNGNKNLIFNVSHFSKSYGLNRRHKMKSYLETKSDFIANNPPDISHVRDVNSVHSKSSRLQEI